MKILIAVDGSAYTKRMLDYLATHADLLGQQHDYTALTVVVPVPPHVRTYLDRAVVDGYYEEEAKKVLEPVSAFAAQQGWQLAAVHAVGHAAEAIAERAKTGGYDLLVMGSHGASTFGTLVLGSTTSRVLALCGTPVLIIR